MSITQRLPSAVLLTLMGTASAQAQTTPASASDTAPESEIAPAPDIAPAPASASDTAPESEIAPAPDIAPAPAPALGTASNTAPAPVPAPDSAPSTAPAAAPAPDAEPVPSAVSAADEAALRAALAADAGPVADEPTPAAATASPAGAQSMNPDLSLIADFAVAGFSDEDRQLQSGEHDPHENGFNLQQLELAFGAAVDPYFRFDANLVFGEHGLELEEAYGTTLDLPARLQLRAGQFLTRFGRFNATHLHAWDFVDQPLAIGRVFGGEGGRGLGAELSWLSPLPWYLELVGSTTMASGEETARSFLGDSDDGVERLGDLLHTVAAKQFFALDDDWSLAWGLSAAFGPNATGRDHYTDVYGTDVYLKWRPISRGGVQAVSLHSEWFYRRRQVPAAVLQDLSGFTQLSWRFDSRWAVSARHDYGSASYDTDFERRVDDLDPEWTDDRHRLAASVSFWPSEFSRLRLQPSVDLPQWQDDPVYALFLALELVAGAHGAHRF